MRHIYKLVEDGNGKYKIKHMVCERGFERPEIEEVIAVYDNYYEAKTEFKLLVAYKKSELQEEVLQEVSYDA